MFSSNFTSRVCVPLGELLSGSSRLKKYRESILSFRMRDLRCNWSVTLIMPPCVHHKLRCSLFKHSPVYQCHKCVAPLRICLQLLISFFASPFEQHECCRSSSETPFKSGLYAQEIYRLITRKWGAGVLMFWCNSSYMYSINCANHQVEISSLEGSCGLRSVRIFLQWT